MRKIIKITCIFLIIGMFLPLYSQADSYTSNRQLSFNNEIMNFDVDFTYYINNFKEQYMQEVNLGEGVNFSVALPPSIDPWLTGKIGSGNFKSLMDTDYQTTLNSINQVLSSLENDVIKGGRKLGLAVKVDNSLYDFLIYYPSMGNVTSPSSSIKVRPKVTNNLQLRLSEILSLFDSNKLISYRRSLESLYGQLTGNDSDLYIQQSIDSYLNQIHNVTETITMKSDMTFYHRIVYKPYHASGIPQIITPTNVSELSQKGSELARKFKTDAERLNIQVKTFRNTGSQIVLDDQDNYGTGARLLQYLRNNQNSLPTLATISLFPTTLTGNRGLSAINITPEYAKVINDSDAFINIGTMNYFKVEYPLYQPLKMENVSEKTYKFSYQKVGLVNLINEMVEIEEVNSTGQVVTSKVRALKLVIGDNGGGLTYHPTLSKNPTVDDLGYVQSSRVMECLEIDGVYYPTGRIIELPTTEFSEETKVGFASNYLASAPKPPMKCYLFDTQSGKNVIMGSNPNILGRCIVLNPLYIEESGLINYLNNEMSYELKSIYKVESEKILQFLLGGHDLPSGSLTIDQALFIDKINKDLNIQSFTRTYTWIRVGLFCLGFIIIAYSSILFIALTVDRSGGVFGFELIPILTFGRLRLETELKTVENTAKVSTKRVWITIITTLIIGVLILSGSILDWAYDLGFKIFTKLGGM